MSVSRREFLEYGLGSAALGLLGCSGEDGSDDDDGWNRGDLHHLLPTVSQRAFQLKLSFYGARNSPPRLRVAKREVQVAKREVQVAKREVEGVQLDVEGRFWSFQIDGLEPATQYSLRLLDGSGEALCDARPLRTFPAPDARPERLRVISYACAGGPNLPIPPSWFNAFRPAAYRQRLFALMVEREPANRAGAFVTATTTCTDGLGRSPRARRGAHRSQRRARSVGQSRLVGALGSGRNR